MQLTGGKTFTQIKNKLGESPFFMHKNKPSQTIGISVKLGSQTKRVTLSNNMESIANRLKRGKNAIVE